MFDSKGRDGRLGWATRMGDSDGRLRCDSVRCARSRRDRQLGATARLWAVVPAAGVVYVFNILCWYLNIFCWYLNILCWYLNMYLNILCFGCGALFCRRWWPVEWCVFFFARDWWRTAGFSGRCASFALSSELCPALSPPPLPPFSSLFHSLCLSGLSLLLARLSLYAGSRGRAAASASIRGCASVQNVCVCVCVCVCVLARAHSCVCVCSRVRTAV